MQNQKQVVTWTLQSIQDRVGTLENYEPFHHQVANAGSQLAQVVLADRAIYAIGNGGSMSDAMHFAAELTGTYRNRSRQPIRAMAVSDPAHITAVANDLGFDEVFSRYISGHGRQGDALVAITTSGRSTNVLKAIHVAKKKGMVVILLSRFNTGDTSNPCSASLQHYELGVQLLVPDNPWADRIQENHIQILHMLVNCVEAHLHLKMS